jgi:hypothetical protein
MMIQTEFLICWRRNEDIHPTAHVTESQNNRGGANPSQCDPVESLELLYRGTGVAM